MFPCILYLCQGYFLWLRENPPYRENSRCIDENSEGMKKKPQKNWEKYQEVAPQIKKKVEKKSNV